jgi:hypothetical protein
MNPKPAGGSPDRITTLRWVVVAGAFAAALGAADVLTVHSAAFARNPALGAAAVAVDLGLAVPLGYYLLAVRHTRLRIGTVPGVAALGLLAAGLLLPTALQAPVHAARLAWLAAALGAIARMGARVVARSRAGSAAVGDIDVLARLRDHLRAALPWSAAADAVAYEAAVLYYALAPWARVANAGGHGAAFSYHRRTGITTALGAALALAIVEAIGVHLLLYRAHPTAAAGLLSVSLYGIVWLLGFLRAVRLRPVLLTDEALHVRLGLLWDVCVPYPAIAGVVAVRSVADERAVDYLRAVALGDPQLVIELHAPLAVAKPYGLGRKHVRRIGLAVDDPAGFAAALNARLAAA